MLKSLFSVFLLIFSIASSANTCLDMIQYSHERDDAGQKLYLPTLSETLILLTTPEFVIPMGPNTSKPQDENQGTCHRAQTNAGAIRQAQTQFEIVKSVLKEASVECSTQEQKETNLEEFKTQNDLKLKEVEDKLSKLAQKYSVGYRCQE